MQREAHVLEVFRYIALNPVRAGLCDEPERWAWSAHSAIAGLTPVPSFLAAEESRDFFSGASGAHGIRAYREYVAAGDAAQMPDVAVLGDDEFCRETLASATTRDAEIPRRYWGPGQPPIAEIMAGDDRAAAIAKAYREHGHTMSAIAAHVGCHVSTVSRLIHAYEQ